MELLVESGMPLSMVPWVEHIDDGYLIAPGHDRKAESLPSSIGADYKVADLGSRPTYSWNKDEQRNRVDGGMRPWRKASEYSRTNRVQSYLYTFHITDFDPGADTNSAAERMVNDGFVPHRVMACPVTGGVQTQHKLEIPVNHKNTNRMDVYRLVNRMIAQRYGGDPMYVNQSAGYSPFSSLLWTLENPSAPYDLDRTSELVGLAGQLVFDLAMPISPPQNLGKRKPGVGFRNQLLFDILRKTGYRNVGRFADVDRFGGFLLNLGFRSNAQFQSPLSEQEIRSTVRSVVRFCWRNRATLASGGRLLPTARENGRRSGLVRAHKRKGQGEGGPCVPSWGHVGGQCGNVHGGFPPNHLPMEGFGQ